MLTVGGHGNRVASVFPLKGCSADCGDRLDDNSFSVGGVDYAFTSIIDHGRGSRDNLGVFIEGRLSVSFDKVPNEALKGYQFCVGARPFALSEARSALGGLQLWWPGAHLDWADETDLGIPVDVQAVAKGEEVLLSIKASCDVGAGESLSTPGAPQGLSVTSGDSELRVNWTAPSGTGVAVTRYGVQHKPSGDARWPNEATAVPLIDGTDAVIKGLDNDVGYDVRVRAYNSAGPGQWTRTVSETPRVIELWSATLTVGRYNNIYYGCDNSLVGFSSFHCTTRLTSSSFTDGDQTYSIDVLRIQKSQGSLVTDLEIDFDRDVSARLAGLHLCVGVTGRTGSYPLSVTQTDNSKRLWARSGPNWSDGDRVELSIRSSCQFWKATLTPKALTSGLGCSSASATAANRCSATATLTDDDFTLAGQPRTIDRIILGSDGTLAVRLGSDIPDRLRAYTLWVGDKPFHFSAAKIDPATPHTATWTEPGLAWTAGRGVVLYLQPGPPLLSDVTFTTPTGTQEVSLDGFYPGGGRSITAGSSSDAVATVTVSDDESALTVTPQGRGTATITVTATYRNGSRTVSTFQVTVKTAPVVKARITNLRGVLGQTVSYDMHDYFEDPDGDPLTFNAVTVQTTRASFSVTPEGMLRITSDSQGSSTIRITASDPDGNTVSQRVQLGVDGYVSWTAAEYRVGEDGTASALLKIRNEPARFSARIGMAWRPGTATGGGVDYTKGSATYTIGRTYSGAFPIAFTLVDDDLVENDETFTVALSVPLARVAGTGFSPGSHTTATVIIEDDDARSAKIAFGTDAASTSALAVSVDEDVSTGTVSVPITVSHLPAASTTFTVEVLATGSAAENTDYAIAAKTVTFGPDDTSKTKNLEITVTDDDDPERDETIKLRIVAADATPDDLGDHYDRDASGSLATVTIVDDDGAPGTFAVSAAAAATEGADAKLTITLSENAPTGGVEFTVTAAYAGQTATAADVGSITSPVTVAENTDSLDITIPLVDDPVDEDGETFTVTVATTATGWVVESTGKDQATVTINDNDTAGVSAGPGGATSGTAPFIVARTRTRTYPVVLTSKPTADVVVTPVSATPSNATVSGPMTFTPDNWNRIQHVTVTAHSRPNDRGTALISHSVTSTDPKYPAGMTLPRVEARIDPFPYVTLQNPTVTVTEPDGTATATTPVQAFISRDHQLYPAFALGFSLGAGTTATHHPTTCGPGVDFVLPFSARVSVPASFWGLSPVLNLTICGDDEHEDDEVIVLEVLSQPASYQSAGKQIITITNNDRASMTVTPTSLLAVAGSTAAYTVVMDHQPAGDVTISATSDTTAAATVLPAAHTFTPTNWNMPATFTVTGVAEGTAAISHAVTRTADATQYPTTLDIDPVTVGVAPPTLWSATLTPTTFPGGALACVDGTPEKGCEPGELLTDDVVTVGATDYPIHTIGLRTEGSFAGSLLMLFDTTLSDGNPGRLGDDLKDLVLRIDDRMLALSDATLDGDVVLDDQLIWASTGLTWAADRKVLLSLVTPRWSATLTPRDLGGEAAGCDNASSAAGDECSAAATLTDDDFDLDGKTYAITALRQTPAQGDTPRRLHVRLDPSPPDELNRYTLMVGRTELDVRDARREADGTLVWDDPAVTLAAGGATTLRLVETGPGVKVSRSELTLVGGAGSKATYTLVLNTPPAGDVVITPTSSAAADASVSGAVTFTPDDWDMPQTVTVTGVSDGAATITHAVTQTADTIQYPVGIHIDDVAAKVLNGYISFESAAYSVRENRRQGALGYRGWLFFALSHSPPSLSYATFAWRDGTATGGGVDYTNGATRFGIAPSVKRSALAFVFVNDDLVEDDETFTVTVTPPPGYELGDHPTATFTIEDDEARSAKIAFGTNAASTSAHAVSVDEDVSAGTLSVPITVNHLPAASTTFEVEVLGGSATENTDYAIATKSVTFGPDDTSKTQNLEITITDDDDTEIDETIRLRIVAADATPDDLGDHYDRHASGSAATVTIDDDDGTPKTFAVSATAAAAEGADATLTITLSENAPTGGVAFSVTAGYAGSSTAVAADVGSITSPVTVAENTDSLDITIPLVDDDLDEDGETFTITIAPASGVTGWVVAAESKDEATVTITDDDTAGVTVSPSSVSVDEAAGASNRATYTLVLDSEPTDDVVVTVSSSDPDAAKVTPASFRFTPTNWDEAETFTVTAVSDDDADDESVTISHTATSTDSDYDGALIGSVLVSVDDDEVKTFKISPAATAVEGASASLTITLSADAPASEVAFTISSDYSNPSTATSADVGSITSPVTVAAGQTTATVMVPLADDDVDEDDETFKITVSASGWSAEDAGKDTATVTITDNDTAGVSVSKSLLSVSEGLTDTYTLVLDTKPAGNVVVSATSGAAGKATVEPVTYTFTPANWSRPEEFTVKGVAEGTATITHEVTQSADTDGYPTSTSVGSVAVTVSAGPDASLQLLRMTLTDAGGTVVPLSPRLSAGTRFTASVDADVSEVKVWATPTDTGATVAIGGTTGFSREVSVGYGDNPVEVVVTASDGVTTETYTVTVKRAYPIPDISSVTEGAHSDQTPKVTVVTTNPDSNAYTVVVQIIEASAEWPARATTNSLPSGLTRDSSSTANSHVFTGLTKGTDYLVRAHLATTAATPVAIADSSSQKAFTAWGDPDAPGGPDTSVWSTTLTVDAAGSLRGCDNAPGGLADCSLALGSDRFSFGGKTLRVQELFVDSGGDLNLAVATSGNVPQALRTASLRIGGSNGVSYPMSSGFRKIYLWNNGPSWTDNQAVTIELLAPSDDLAVTAGDEKLTVGWVAPADAGGRGASITGYDIEYKESEADEQPATGGDPSTGWVATTAGSTATSVEVTSLKAGTGYDVRVRAKNAVGASAWTTGSGTPTAELPVPTVGSVVLGANPDGSPSLLFGYTNPDSDVYDVVFQVKEDSAEWPARSAAALVAAVVPGTKFLRTGLNKGTTYQVRAHLVVKSSSAVIEASSAVTTVTTWDNPSVPTGLGVAAGDGKLVVSWTAPTNTGGVALSGYDVEYKTDAALDRAATIASDPGSGWVATTAASTATSVEIAGLANGTEYDVRVRAKNPAGASSWLSGSGTPADATVASLSSLQVTLTDTDNTVVSLTPRFTPTRERFTVRVDDDVAEVKVAVVPTDTNASVAIDGVAGATKTVSLDFGDNTITIVVTAADGTTTQTYTITAKRAYPVPTITSVTEGAHSDNTPNVTVVTTNPDSNAYTVAVQIKTKDAAWPDRTTTHSMPAGVSRDSSSTADSHVFTGLTKGTDYLVRAHLVTTGDTSVAIADSSSEKAFTAWDNPDAPGGTDTTVWSTTLTVDTDGDDKGCDNAPGGLADCSTGLGSDQFSFGGKTLSVTELSVDSSGNLNLTVATTGDVPVGLRTASLRIGGSGGTLYPLTSGLGKIYSWNNGPTWTDNQAVTIELLAPSNQPTVTTGDAKLTIAWVAPADAGGRRATITGYDIEYKESSAADWTDLNHSGTETTAEITSLTNGTTYNVRVRAKNAVGDSDWITGSGTPAASPTEPAATPKKLRFKHTTVQVSESRDGPNHVVRVIRSGDISDEVSFALTFADGTATVDADYRGDQRPLKIGANKRHRDVLLRIVNDGIIEADDETFTVTLSPTTVGYTAGKALTVTIVDDDEVGVKLSETELTVDEKNTVTYKLKLTSKPTHDVTITATSGDASKVRLHRDEMKTRTFTPDNWNKYQKLTVRAKPIGDATVTITHTATSDDTAYDGVAIAPITVTVSDIVELPSAVIDLDYTLTGNSVTVTWTAPAAPDMVSRYYVKVMPADSNTVADAKERLRRPQPSETLSETFRNLVAGAIYRISVRAVGPDHPGKGERTFTMEFTVPASPPS